MNWYIKVIKKYVTFGGRARRAEYWYFVLFNFLIAIAIAIVEGVLGQSGNGFLSGLYNLFILLPSLAVFVRRLHDTGRSGWWFFIAFIPIIGFIVLLVFLCQDSQPNDNQYGRNPKSSSY